MVAYRFTLPDEIRDSTYQSVSLTDLRVPVQTARYLRSGLRVVVAVSGSDNGGEDPPDSWDFLRGDAASTSGHQRVAVSASTVTPAAEGVTSWGLAGQKEASYLTLSRPQEAALTAQPGTDVNGKKFIWVIVSLEDYTDYWALYDAKTPRYYSIEGSGTVVASEVRFTFDQTVTESVPQRGVYMTTGVKIGTYPICPFEYPISANVATGYGSIVRAALVSRMVAYTTSMPVLHQAWMNAPTKFMEQEVSNDTTDTYVGDVVTPSEMGCIASMRLAVDRNGGLFWRAVCDTTLTKVGVNESDGQLSLRNIPHISRVTVGYGATVVPAAMGYTGAKSIRLVPDTDDTAAPFVMSRGDISILAWRTRSPAALNFLARGAIAALAAKRAFFTGETGEISATLELDGSLTQQLSLEVAADLVGIGAFEADQFVGQNIPTWGDGLEALTIPLDKPVAPGDVIVLVPRLDKVIYADNQSIGMLPVASDGTLDVKRLDGWRPKVSFCF